MGGCSQGDFSSDVIKGKGKRRTKRYEVTGRQGWIGKKVGRGADLWVAAEVRGCECWLETMLDVCRHRKIS